MASTGSKLAAEIAGKIPEISPIRAAKVVPKTIFPKLKTNSKSSAFVKISAIPQTINNPIIPPITERIMASNKN